MVLDDSVNVTVGEKEERMMMTGMHTVVDIFCVGCGSIVGWKYVRSFIACIFVSYHVSVLNAQIYLCWIIFIDVRKLLTRRAKNTK